MLNNRTSLGGLKSLPTAKPSTTPTGGWLLTSTHGQGPNWLGLATWEGGERERVRKEKEKEQERGRDLREVGGFAGLTWAPAGLGRWPAWGWQQVGFRFGSGQPTQRKRREGVEYERESFFK